MNDCRTFYLGSENTGFPQDAAPSNNALPFVVKVVRDKFVLQVSGSPSYDQKFETILKQDPSVELVGFFILRTEEDLVRDGQIMVIIDSLSICSLFSKDWNLLILLCSN